MTVYLTLKCDGMMPPGSKERCRAGFSVQATMSAPGWGGDRADVADAKDAAHQHGWTEEFVSFGEQLQFCPSCTRHRAEAAHA